MGYYINEIGTSFAEKVNTLKDKHGATDTDSSFKDNLVCVIDNGMFAAAGYAYSQRERDLMAEYDGRRKTWLVVPNAKQLSGFI